MKKSVKHAHYIERLAQSISTAIPYHIDPDAKLTGLTSKANIFPNAPGVYLIMRKVDLPDTDYTTRGVNTKAPLILYVGKTTSRRTIKDRLSDHFSGNKLNYQRSQFRKFLYQVCQDHSAVKRILWSANTLIACVPIEEDDVVIDSVEKLAIQVFRPRFNIRDR